MHLPLDQGRIDSGSAIMRDAVVDKSHLAGLNIDIDDRDASDAGDDASWSGDLEACRRIVQSHGGALEIEHAKGRGFSFHVELPVTAGGSEALVAS